MRLLLRTLLAQLAISPVFAQSAASTPNSPPNEPKAFVKSLYMLVVARAPYSILYGADMKPFAPYLSTTLRHRISSAKACERDYHRQHPDDPKNPVKYPFAWAEWSMFGGADEKVAPQVFGIESIKTRTDGSILVAVRLGITTQFEKPYFWRVVPILVRQDGRLALDDVIFIHEPDPPDEPDELMSKTLSQNCRNGHWIDGVY